MRQKRQWLPVADMMTGLFLIFLFIALVTVQGKKESEPSNPYAESYKQSSKEIHSALMREFRRDLRRWNARIDIDKADPIIRFKDPKVLFEQGDSKLKQRFQRILSDFFPRYLRVLRPYCENIRGFKIEGHTSSEWQEGTPKKQAFRKNMELSQERTQSVLEYLFSLGIYDKGFKQCNKDLEQWVIEHITTHGFSSTHLILDDEGIEQKEASRRVEFRIEIDTKKIIGIEK